MILIDVRTERHNDREFGYGLYVNGYVTDSDFDSLDSGLDGEMGLYASECVPFGQASNGAMKAAGKRVRRTALRRYRAELARI